MDKPGENKSCPKFPEENGCGVLVEGKENSITLTELHDVRDETIERTGTKFHESMMYLSGVIILF